MKKDYNNLQMSLFGRESQQMKRKEEKKLQSQNRGQTTSPSIFMGGVLPNNADNAGQEPTSTRN
jgi:glutaredoxin